MKLKNLLSKKRKPSKTTPSSEPETSSAPLEQQLEKRSNLPQQKVFDLSTTEPKPLDEYANAELTQPILNKSRTVAPVIPLPDISFDPAQLRLGGATFERVVKSTTIANSPIIAFIKVGLANLVVKARTRDAPDHVVNSKLLRALSIGGGHAPRAEILTSVTAGILGGALASNLNASELSMVLRQGDTTYTDSKSKETSLNRNQISERSPATASNLSDLLLAQSSDAVPRTIKVLDATNERYGLSDPKTSLIQALKAVGKPTRYTKEEWSQILADLAGDAGARTAALKRLRDALQSTQQTKVDKPVPENMAAYFDLIEKAGNGTLDQDIALWQEKAGVKKRVQDHLSSPEGAYKLAALAAVDFVDGMDDRILTKFNPDNLQLDTQQTPDGSAPQNDFWCIDNAKNPKNGLTATDDQQDETWNGFVDGKMQQQVSATYARTDRIGYSGIIKIITGEIYGNVYADIGEGSVGRKPMEAVIGRAVMLTLEEMKGVLQDPQLPPAVAAKLTSRLQRLGILDRPAMVQGSTATPSDANAPTVSSPRPIAIPQPSDVPQLPVPQPLTGPTLTPTGGLAASSQRRPGLQRAQPVREPMPTATDGLAPSSQSRPPWQRAERFVRPTLDVPPSPEVAGQSARPGRRSTNCRDPSDSTRPPASIRTSFDNGTGDGS
jgi:hypothetical protein